MKKEQKIQQFEKIVDANEALGLEMKDLKGGLSVVCHAGTVSGTKSNPTTTCHSGVITL